MNRRARSRAVAGLAIALGAVLVGAVPASAAGSNWWYDYYDVGAAHAAGWTGKGVTIAVLDGGIDPDVPALQGADLTVDPDPLCARSDGKRLTASGTDMATKWHGTNVTTFIVGNGTGPSKAQGVAPDAKILFFASGLNDGMTCDRGQVREFAAQIYQAVDAGADIITTSVGWQTPGQDGVNAIAYALAKGVVVLAAQANSQMGVFEYPGRLNGVVEVSAINAKGEIEIDEDVEGQKAIHEDSTVVAPGEGLLGVGDRKTGDWSQSTEIGGTSFATPITAAVLADVWQKYPRATSNQILQSLIRNTTHDDHALMRDEEDGYGYGPVSLSHLLRVDPTQYPDENPLFDKGFGKPTTATVDAISAKIAAGEDAEPKHVSSFDAYGDTGTTTAESPLAGFGSALPLWLLIGGGVLALLVVAGVVLTIVLVRRRRKRAEPTEIAAGQPGR